MIEQSKPYKSRHNTPATIQQESIQNIQIAQKWIEKESLKLLKAIIRDVCIENEMDGIDRVDEIDGIDKLDDGRGDMHAILNEDYWARIGNSGRS